MRTLYFDCFSGASGDMILGALIDAGAPESTVTDAVGQLSVSGWALDVSSVHRGPLRATRVEVTADEQSTSKSLRDIHALIEESALPETIKRRSLAVFDTLGRAEARVHGHEIDDVRLHEAGTLDALVDIVGSCAAIEHFMPARVVTSPIATGRGIVDSDHGTIPVPAPAVTEILQGATLYERGSEELVTPTGAAILATISDGFGEMPAMTIGAVGYGAGAREGDIPNVLRVLVGTEQRGAEPSADKSLLLEANIDDMSPEAFPYVIDALLAAGAQDAWVTPIVMKKGRPGFTLAALSDPMHRYHLLEIIFRETTTFGVRSRLVTRDILDRSFTEVEVEGHPVRVKIGAKSGDVVTVAVEHDDAVEVARKTGLPLKDVYASALDAARDEVEVTRRNDRAL